MNQSVIKLLGVFLVSWLSVDRLPARDATNFEAGNAAFHTDDYTQAAVIYQKLIDSEGSSASLLYNLGNSQFQLGDHGAAILSYERAKLIAPRDPDLLANLILARKAATVFPDIKYNPWLDRMLGFLSRDEWSWWVVVAAFWIGVMAISGNFARNARPWLRKLRWGSMLISAIIILLGGVILFLRRDEGLRGIVISESAAVRLSPFEKAEAVGNPGAGRSVQIGEKKGEYYFVQVPGTDLQGWMDRTEVKRIGP